jgi:hypothetical protein
MMRGRHSIPRQIERDRERSLDLPQRAGGDLAAAAQ